MRRDPGSSLALKSVAFTDLNAGSATMLGTVNVANVRLPSTTASPVAPLAPHMEEVVKILWGLPIPPTSWAAVGLGDSFLEWGKRRGIPTLEALAALWHRGSDYRRENRLAIGESFKRGGQAVVSNIKSALDAPSTYNGPPPKRARRGRMVPPPFPWVAGPQPSTSTETEKEVKKPQ